MMILIYRCYIKVPKEVQGPKDVHQGSQQLFSAELKNWLTSRYKLSLDIKFSSKIWRSKVDHKNVLFFPYWTVIYQLIFYHVRSVFRVHNERRIRDNARSRLLRRNQQHFVDGEIISGYFNVQLPRKIRVVHYNQWSSLLFSYQTFEHDSFDRVRQFVARSANFDA